MVAELATCAVLIVVTGAELLHASRTRRVAPLAFGPGQRPAWWARIAPALRTASLAALCWGLVTLMLLTPKIHQANAVPDGDYRHVMLVLDVSPSMRLQDAGPGKDGSSGLSVLW